MNLTHNNHLHWDLDGEPAASRTTSDQTFNFSLGRLSREPRSWAYEFNDALSKLVDTHGSSLDVMFSGGADSEVLVRGLAKLGVKPNLHTIVFGRDLNRHETSRVDSLASELGLTVVYHPHDITAHIKAEGYLDLAVKLQCSQIAYLTVVDVLSKFDNVALMGGEVYLQKHQQPSPEVQSAQEWGYVYREDEDGMTYRYSKLTGHPLVNEVMTYTPELLYAWLTHPVIVNTVRGNTPGKITILSLKKKVYETELGLSLNAKVKYHGYELLGWTNRHVMHRLKDLWPKQQTKRWEYHQLISHLESSS